MKSFPAPIAIAYKEFQEEENSFRKLHRLIDTFESILKYCSVIAIQDFYYNQMESEYPDFDAKIKGKISRPQLGHWAEFLREILKFFRLNKEKLFCPELYLFHFKNFGKRPVPNGCFKSEGISNKLLKLRNQLAHGTTISDEESMAKIVSITPLLEDFLDKISFFENYPLYYLENKIGEKSFSAMSMMGADYARNQAEQLFFSTISAKHIGHVLLLDLKRENILDLHPFLLFENCNGEIANWDKDHINIIGRNTCNKRKMLLYNYFERKKHIFFIDYQSGHLSKFKKTDEIAHEFNNYSKENTTPVETFVGREKELNSLENFSWNHGSNKKVLIALGPPGCGKTALLEKYAGMNKDAIKHFIRQGDSSTTTTVSVFENITAQLSDQFHIENSNPISNRVAGYRKWFDDILSKCAEKSDKNIVIVIDGLDEAERANHFSQQTRQEESTIVGWLPDPHFLPDNVRLILSSRLDILEIQSFKSKYDSDKANHLHIGKLSDDDIKGLFFQVYNKYEVLSAEHYIKQVVKVSEGNPLYMKMLMDDILEERIQFGDSNVLPNGMISYFERIVNDFDEQDKLTERDDSETEIESQRELLEALIKAGDISPEKGNERLDKLPKKGNNTNSILQLLSLFCLTKEPITIEFAEDILKCGSIIIQNSFNVIRSVLTAETSENKYRLFHSKFREFFLLNEKFSSSNFNKYRDVIEKTYTKLITWSNDWHKNGAYAHKHLPIHLTEAFLFCKKHKNEDGAQKYLWKLNSILSDVNYIKESLNNNRLYDLLAEYQNIRALLQPNLDNDNFDIIVAWYRFLDHESYILNQYPELVVQQGLNSGNHNIVDRIESQINKSRQPVQYFKVIDQNATPYLTPLRTMAGHDSAITCLAATSDEKKFISASKNNTIKVWDINTGKLLKTLRGHKEKINVLKVSADNKYLFSGSDDTTVKMWDLEKLELVKTITKHTNPILSLDITYNGCYMVTKNKWGVEVWDLFSDKNDQATYLNLDFDGRNVNNILIMPETNYLFISSLDGPIKAYNLKTKKEIIGLVEDDEQEKFGTITDFFFSKNGHKLLANSLGEIVEVLIKIKDKDYVNGHCVLAKKGEQIPDNTGLNEKELLKIYKGNTLFKNREVRGFFNLKCYVDNNLLLWKTRKYGLFVRNLLQKTTDKIPFPNRITDHLLLEKEQQLLTGDSDGKIKLFDTKRFFSNKNNIVKTEEPRGPVFENIDNDFVSEKYIDSRGGENFEKISDMYPGGDRHQISPDGKYYVWVKNSKLYLKNLRKGEKKELAVFDKKIKCLEITPDSKYVVWGNHQRLGITDILTGERINEIDGQEPLITPDSRYIITKIDSSNEYDDIPLTGDEEIFDIPLCDYDSSFSTTQTSEYISSELCSSEKKLPTKQKEEKYPEVKIWEIKTGNLVNKIVLPYYFNGFFDVYISPGKQYLIIKEVVGYEPTVDFDGEHECIQSALIYKLNTWEKIFQIKEEILDLTFINTDRFLIYNGYADLTIVEPERDKHDTINFNYIDKGYEFKQVIKFSKIPLVIIEFVKIDLENYIPDIDREPLFYYQYKVVDIEIKETILPGDLFVNSGKYIRCQNFFNELNLNNISFSDYDMDKCKSGAELLSLLIKRANNSGARPGKELSDDNMKPDIFPEEKRSQISPDGKYYVWVENSKLYIRNLINQKSEKEPAVFDKKIKCLEITPDSKYVVWGNHQRLGIVDILTGKTVNEIDGKYSLITPDNRYIITKIDSSNEYDGDILFPGAEEIDDIPLYSRDCSCPTGKKSKDISNELFFSKEQVSPKEKTDKHSKIKIWEIKTGNLVKEITLSYDERDGLVISISPGKQYLIIEDIIYKRTADQEDEYECIQSALIIKLNTWEKIFQVKEEILDLTFINIDRFLIYSGYTDLTIVEPERDKLYTIKNNYIDKGYKLKQVIKFSETPLVVIEFVKKGPVKLNSYVYANFPHDSERTFSYRYQLIDIERRKTVLLSDLLINGENFVFYLNIFKKLNLDTNTFFNQAMYSCTSGAKLLSLLINYESESNHYSINNIEISGDKKHAVVTTKDNTIQIVDNCKNKIIQYDLSAIDKNEIKSVSISHDGNYLFYSTDKCHIKVWRIVDRNIIAIFPHETPIEKVKCIDEKYTLSCIDKCGEVFKLRLSICPHESNTCCQDQLLKVEPIETPRNNLKLSDFIGDVPKQYNDNWSDDEYEYDFESDYYNYNPDD